MSWPFQIAYEGDFRSLCTDSEQMGRKVVAGQDIEKMHHCVAEIDSERREKIACSIIIYSEKR